MEEIKLYDHNEEGYQSIIKSLEDSNFSFIERATGTGKSYILIKYLATQMAGKRVLFVTTHEPMFDQLVNRDMPLLGTSKEIYDKLDLVIYPNINKNSAKYYFDNYDCFIFDEAHHCGATVWGETIGELRDLIDLGFLNMRENTAAALLSGTLLESAVYGDEPFSEKNTYPTTFEDYEQIDEYEDAKYGNNATDGDEVENTAEATTMSETLESILVTLTERERLMIILKFGLDPHKYMTENEQKYFGDEAKVRTMNEISNIFNVSPERVRMVIAKALRKLRHPNRSKKVQGYYI